MTRTLINIILASSLPLTAACGGEDHGHVTPAEDACEHMLEGPAIAVTAIDDSAGDPPDLDESHHRYDVTLVTLAADRGGYLDLVSAAAGDIHLFLGTDLPVTLWDDQGSEVAPEATMTTVAACAEVAVGYTYDLGVGTYTVDLGPTTATAVAIVPVHGGEDDAH